MRIAQQTAQNKKKDVVVVWRGYKTTVHAAGPVFTTNELRGYLVLALNDILKNRNMTAFDGGEEEAFQRLSEQYNQSRVTQVSTPPRLVIKNKKKTTKNGNVTDIEVILY